MLSHIRYYLFFIIIPLTISVRGQSVPDIATTYVSPRSVLWATDTALMHASQRLAEPFVGQATVSAHPVCVLRAGDGVLLDFGRELHGGLRITSAIRPDKHPARVRVRLGESVTEAMSDVETSTATNDHAMRDYTVEVPWLGAVSTGDTGFRFARVEALDSMALPLLAVEAVSRVRPMEYAGSFSSSDPRLDSIWATGAYTVQLNMQDYIWDGIKRDRLVWIGDMHPEVMTITNVFEADSLIRRSLDLARDDTPLPGWMNGMCSYSLWWIIIQHDLYMHTGDKEYLMQQIPYLKELVRQIMRQVDNGTERLDGATRFLDWPTSEMPDVIHSGLQALTVMALDDARAIFDAVGDKGYAEDCAFTAAEMRLTPVPLAGAKQDAALAILAGTADKKAAADIIAADGPEGFSTFFGYYMLEALARAGRYQEAIDIISRYWGSMLDLGATTFWEDLTWGDVAKASPIDNFVPDGAYDIHADGGNYCYRGLRHSLCHGWASGPTAWMSRYILGIRPLSPGFDKVLVDPHLGHLDFAQGSVPTPKGIIQVRHERNADGTYRTDIIVPDGVKIYRP